tara:strand:- start:218 stop:415 length:198 start_codon:yes stop_codon:yes gene_type:complete
VNNTSISNKFSSKENKEIQNGIIRNNKIIKINLLNLTFKKNKVCERIIRKNIFIKNKNKDSNKKK